MAALRYIRPTLTRSAVRYRHQFSGVKDLPAPLASTPGTYGVSIFVGTFIAVCTLHPSGETVKIILYTTTGNRNTQTSVSVVVPTPHYGSCWQSLLGQVGAVGNLLFIQVCHVEGNLPSVGWRFETVSGQRPVVQIA